jgi:hypothetical protein
MIHPGRAAIAASDAGRYPEVYTSRRDSRTRIDAGSSSGSIVHENYDRSAIY